MPRVTIRKSDGVVAIGPLAAGSDFQVRQGVCTVTTETPVTDIDHGFRMALGDRWFVAAGKTVRVQSTGLCVLHYEPLA